MCLRSAPEGIGLWAESSCLATGFCQKADQGVGKNLIHHGHAVLKNCAKHVGSRRSTLHGEQARILASRLRPWPLLLLLLLREICFELMNAFTGMHTSDPALSLSFLPSARLPYRPFPPLIAVPIIPPLRAINHTAALRLSLQPIAGDPVLT